MIPRDLLNGLPAKASTPVAGHWIIRSSDHVRLRKYILLADPQDVDVAEPGTGPRDALERAWREINSQGGSEAIDILSHGCGIVVRSGGLDNEAEPALYVFSSGTQVFSFPGLRESSGDLLDPAKLFSCSVHGNDYQCLVASTPTSADDIAPRDKCKDLVWAPSPELKDKWKLLTDALVERLAWRRGRRLITRPGPYVFNGHKELQSSLRPLTAFKLVLQVTPSLTPRPTLGLSLPNRPVLLHPVFLPALVLGPFTPTEPQAASLSDAFSALGSTWTMDKAGKQLIAELDRKTYAAWSVVWVPLSTKSPEQWTAGSGILTIWPSHLLLDLMPSSSTRIPISQPPSTIFPGSHNDFMSSAVNIYESMVIDRETNIGDPPTIHQETTSAVVDSPESPMFGSDSGDKSDLDDLFSSHSSADEDGNDLGFELLSDLPDDEPAAPEAIVELDRDVVMESPHGQGSDIEDEPQDADVTQITEDDFAFFDSPPPPGLPEKVESPGAIEAVEPIEEPIQTISESVVSLSDQDKFDNKAPSPAVEAIESPRKPNPTKKVQFAPSPPRLTPSVSHSSEDADTIPPEFQPISLSGGLPSSFPYSLPTPAASPEDLRTELLERLSSPKEKKPHNYASDWDVESEMSDVEEDDSPLGPLTPESMIEDEEPGNDSLTPDSSRLDELRWRGKMCITTEWIWMRDELDGFAFPWESAWVEQATLAGATFNMAKNVDTTIFAELECTRLARHIMADRHLRAYILSHDSYRTHREEDESLAWTKEGSALYDLLEPSDSDMIEASNNPKSLAPLEVHAAYAGNVMRLGAAGLQYWLQLGLAPLGGSKNISLSILYEKGDGAEVAASGFLQQLERVYESLHLGKLIKGDSTRTLTPVKISDLLLTLNTRLCQNIDNAIILCITHSADLRTTIQASFSSQLVDSPHDSFCYHLFPGRFPSHEDLFHLAFELYDRLPRPVKPVSIRGLPMTSETTSTQSPHFSLVNAALRTPELTLAWPLQSYDITGRWKIVHCAYAHDVDLGMIVAVIMDSEGQSWHINTWNGKRVGAQLKEIWSWFHQMAETVAVEYRLAICCPMDLTVSDLDAWRDLIKTRRVPTTLLHSSDRPFGAAAPALPKPVATVPPALLGDSSSRLIDESLCANFASFTHLLPLSLHSAETGNIEEVFPQSTFLLNVTLPELSYATSAYHVMSHDAPPGREHEDINLLLAEDYHWLIGLGRMRFGFESTSPAHIHGVYTVLDCMRRVASV